MSRPAAPGRSLYQETDLSERRKFIRVPKKGLVRFRPINLPKTLLRQEESFYKNISAGGLLFESPRPIKIGTVLTLEIELRDWSRFQPPSEPATLRNGTLKILAEVLHCEEIIAGNTYNIGERFVNLEHKFQEAILNYLADYLEQHD